MPGSYRHMALWAVVGGIGIGGGPDGCLIGLMGEHADATLIELVVETADRPVT